MVRWRRVYCLLSSPRNANLPRLVLPLSNHPSKDTHQRSVSFAPFLSFFFFVLSSFHLGIHFSPLRVRSPSMSQTMSMSARTPSIHELHHESASTSALPSPKLVPAPSQEDKQKNALADIKRRKRTTPEALAVLSVAFAENPLPNLQKRKALAEQLSMCVQFCPS